MSDDEEFELQLPDWIQVLLRKAEDQGYSRGLEDGKKELWYALERELKTVRPYGA